jgi:4-hydroxy-tetrahydrodipicolinate synthase
LDERKKEIEFMNYTKTTAKAYAKQHFVGVFAATPMAMLADGTIDEAGYSRNLEHWIGTLKLGGLFVCGKQAEYFSLSVAERKRDFEIVQSVANGRCVTVMSCSDTNLDVVIDLAKHAQTIGADYVIIHSPVLHFGADTDETIYEYYRHLSEVLDIGIALWNHPDCGYEMSPQLCLRIALLPNIVAIKYSVSREKYTELTRLAGHLIHVSTASEDEWFDNIVNLGWRLYLCSTPPVLLQTANDQRINEYTRLAFEGKIEQAKIVRDSLNPAREAFKAAKPHGKPQAISKYWLELLGFAGGPVRRPLLQLTEAEKAHARACFVKSGLKL